MTNFYHCKLLDLSDDTEMFLRPQFSVPNNRKTPASASLHLPVVHNSAAARRDSRLDHVEALEIGREIICRPRATVKWSSMLLPSRLGVSGVGGAMLIATSCVSHEGGYKVRSVTFAKVNLAPLHTHHNLGSRFKLSGLHQTLIWHLSAQAPVIPDVFKLWARLRSTSEPVSLSQFYSFDFNLIKHIVNGMMRRASLTIWVNKGVIWFIDQCEATRV